MKNKKCDGCRQKSDFIIHMSLTSKLCRDCFVQERDTKRTLIRSMKEVSDIAPPLGYKFVQNEIFAIDKVGKAYADAVYVTKYWGVSN